LRYTTNAGSLPALLAACSLGGSLLFHACNTIMNLAGNYLSHDIDSLSGNQQKTLILIFSILVNDSDKLGMP